MDIDGVIRLYGCDASDNATDCNNDTIRLLDEIEVDEDASQGNAGGNTAPWVGVNASVGAGKDLVILAIYYQTSDQEDLIGGEAYCPMDLADDDSCPVTQRDAETNVVYTEDEIDDNDALVVLAEADGQGVGEEDSVNLYLRETGLFTGRYEGYLRLTDANGAGKDDNDAVIDWGREIKHGVAPSGGTDADARDAAAVLGVESGEVTIEYVDSDGRTRTLRIEIDNQPPAVQVTSPVHKSASDDHSPDFNGSLEDTDSGLVAESFRLVIDNDADGEENDDFVINMPDADAVTAPHRWRFAHR